MTVMDVETSVAPAELNLDPNRSSDGLAVRCDDIVKTYGTGSSQVVGPSLGAASTSTSKPASS